MRGKPNLSINTQDTSIDPNLADTSRFHEQISPPPLSQTLQSILPDFNFDKLFQGLHYLFGKNQVVLTGSAAKAVQIKTLNPSQTNFRTPNDLDFIVSEHQLGIAPLNNSDKKLADYGLSIPNPDITYQLRYEHNDHHLLIDLINSNNQAHNRAFQKCFTGRVEIDGFHVASVPDLISQDQFRLAVCTPELKNQIENDLKTLTELSPPAINVISTRDLFAQTVLQETPRAKRQELDEESKG